MEKKLYKSEENKILLGICGGIGEYFDIDPVIIRLLLVVLIFLGFSGIFAYIIAAFVIPKRPEAIMNSTPSSREEGSKPGIIKAYEGTYKVEKEEKAE
jgi:phage shock protein C